MKAQSYSNDVSSFFTIVNVSQIQSLSIVRCSCFPLKFKYRSAIIEWCKAFGVAERSIGEMFTQCIAVFAMFYFRMISTFI